jgi:peptide/nickel transport system permease protein
MSRANLKSRLAVTWLTLWFGIGIFITTQNFDLTQSLRAPSLTHIFGTDVFGRDLLQLTLNASKMSAFYALLITISTSILGLVFGGGLVLFPKRFLFYSERILDFFLAFPGILIALAIQSILGSGVTSLMIAIFAGLLPGLIRYISTKAKEVILEDYVQAGLALGSSTFGILFRHLLPALVQHLLIKLPFLFASALLLEATLSFLNLGAPPGTATWGSLLAHGKDYLIEAPRIALTVGFPLVFTLLSLQILADQKR